MYISKIIIKGFRSFGSEVQIPINKKLTAFIGQNSSGKTTALEALRKIFGLYNEREIFKDDFHMTAEEDKTAIKKRDLSIEVQFKFEKDNPNAIPHFFSDMVVNAEGMPLYLRTRLEATWTDSEIHQAGEIDTKCFYVTVPEGATESEDIKRVFPSHLRQLIQVLYVPAIRKPSDQIKYASGSMLYRVLRKIKWDDSFKKDFDGKIKEIGELFDGLEAFSVIQASINSFWSQFHKDPRYKETALGFGQSDFESVLKRMEVTFSPTATDRPFKVDEMGEGYRSLFYLTLVCALLEVEDKLAAEDDDIGITRPLVTVLAIEEPENHIAPQLLGRVTTILNKIADAPSAQIFLSSHTSAIVKRVAPEAICHFRINNYESEVNTIVLPEPRDEAYKYVKEAIHHFPEMYFAKLVVIGEGDSEEVVLGRFTEILKLSFDDNLITFAPLGHRFVNHIWKLLTALKIPYITILDLDLGRHGGGWGRVHYALKQLMDVNVSPKKLLALENGRQLSPERFNEMPTWPNDLATMNGWIDFLQGYDIYFSSPLDIDFLMLEHYSEFYKKAIPKSGGPTIPDKRTKLLKFQARVAAAVQATLKSEKAKGEDFTDEQKELMIWYQYHFLGRGKPVTHIMVLSEMTPADVKGKFPPVLKSLFRAIIRKVK